jgi:hypothetical protein
MPVAALARLLRSALGDEKALEVVTAALEEMRLPANADLAQRDALGVLERVAKTQGLVGIAARFAMSHVHMRWGMER